MKTSWSTAGEPLVTVITPVYNGEAHLAESMRSILEQTVTDLELIIVDDGSTDGSAAVAESIGDSRVRVVRASHGGEGSARNIGLNHAAGMWVAWHDADDIALPHRLQLLLHAVERGADFAHHDMVYIDEVGQPMGYLGSRQVPRRHVLQHLLRTGTPFANGTMMIKRSLVEHLRFNEQLTAGVDTDFVRRFAMRTTGVHVPEPLALYRQRSSATTTSETLQRQWPHLAALVAEEPLEGLVPLAFSSTSETPTAVARALVAMHLFRRGFPEGATIQFDAAVAAGFDAEGERLIRACVALAGTDAREAMSQLSRASTSCLSLVLEGDAYAMSGNYNAAYAKYHEALAADPDAYDALFGIRALGQAIAVRRDRVTHR